MNQPSLHLLFGKLFALLTVDEAEEKGCNYSQTELWQKYETAKRTINHIFITSRAEKVIFKKQDKQIYELLKQIAMILAQEGIPKHFTLHHINDIQFAMGFWSNLPEDRIHFSHVNDWTNEQDYDDNDDDAASYQRVINKYPGAIPGYALEELPDCYSSLVDDGQYE